MPNGYADIEAQAKQEQQKILEAERQARAGITAEAEKQQADIRAQVRSIESGYQDVLAKARKERIARERRIRGGLEAGAPVDISEYENQVKAAQDRLTELRLLLEKATGEAHAEVSKAVKEAEADLEKWKAEAIKARTLELQQLEAARLAQEAEATRLMQMEAAPDKTPEAIFNDWKREGKVDANSEFVSGHITGGIATINYNTPVKDTRTPAEIFEDMKRDDPGLANAVYIGHEYEGDKIKFNYSLPDTRTPEQIFADEQKAGRIPGDATYIGYDAGAGVIHYSTPSEGEAEKSIIDYWSKEARTISNYPMTHVKMPFEIVVPKQLAFPIYAVGKLVGKQNLPPPQTLGEAIKGIVQPVPIVSTMVYWNEMDATQRALSIALDTLVVAPLAAAGARAGYTAIKAKTSPAGTALKNLKATELERLKGLSKSVERTYGKDTVPVLKDLYKAETDYIDALVKLNKTEAKFAELKEPKALQDLRKQGTRAQIEEAERAFQQPLTEAKVNAALAEQKLYTAANKWADKLKGQAGFDSPEMAKMVTRDLPKEIVRNTNYAVTDILKPAKTDVKALREAVIRAQDNLKTAQAKFPTEPSKWADLLSDLAIAETRLEQAQKGSLLTMYDELLAARQRLAKATTTEARLKAQAEVYRLEAEVAKGIRGMEILYPKDGFGSGRSAVATMTKPPEVWTPSRVSGVRAAPVVEPVTALPLPRLVNMVETDYGVKPAEIQIVAPAVKTDIETITSGITDTKLISQTEQLIDTAAQQAYELMVKGYPVTEVMSSVQQMVEAKLETMPELKTQLQAKLLAKTAVRIAERVKTRRPLPFKLKLPDGTTLELTKEQYDGIIAWKQGWVYKMIYPPYGEDDAVNSRKPIAGVQYAKGVGSAQKSAIAKGQPKEVVTRDMGVVDIKFVTPRGARKPKLKFTPDPKQKTTVTPSIGVVR